MKNLTQSVSILLILVGILSACNLIKDEPSPKDNDLSGEWLLTKATIKITPKIGNVKEYVSGKGDHTTHLHGDGRITGIPIFFMDELLIMGDGPSANYTYKTDGDVLSVGVMVSGLDIDKMLFKYSANSKTMVWTTDISLIRKALDDTGGSGLLLDWDEEDLEEYKAVDIRYEFERK